MWLGTLGVWRPEKGPSSKERPLSLSKHAAQSLHTPYMQANTVQVMSMDILAGALSGAL